MRTMQEIFAKQRSQAGILIYVENTTINFYNKIQNTVESSIFGSEFVALRISTDLVEALRYKLMKFDEILEGPSEVYCDNK